MDMKSATDAPKGKPSPAGRLCARRGPAAGGIKACGIRLFWD